MIVLNEIDYDNPLIGLIDGSADERLSDLIYRNPNTPAGIIKNVTYKVSKNKNPYARITLHNKKDSVLCFKLDSKIFTAGEMIAYRQDKPPFIQIIERVRN